MLELGLELGKAFGGNLGGLGAHEPLDGSDPLRLLWTHQHTPRALLAAGEAALLHADARAGELGDDIGEVGLVPDEQYGVESGRELERVEVPALETVVDRRFEPEVFARDARRSPR